MAFNNSTQGNPEANWSVQYLILKWLDKMAEEQANDSDKYYVYFTNALQLAQAYIPVRRRFIIEEANDLLTQYLLQIAELPNESVRVNLSRKYKRSFADAHKFYIYFALTRMNVAHPHVEGVIDFSVIEFEKVQKIIQDDSIVQGGTKTQVVSNVEQSVKQYRAKRKSVPTSTDPIDDTEDDNGTGAGAEDSGDEVAEGDGVEAPSPSP